MEETEVWLFVNRTSVPSITSNLSPLLYHSTLPKVNDNFCHTINLYHNKYKYTTNLKIK